MLTTLLKGKLHMACVTQAELWYDGSCAIDASLVKLAGLREFEQIDIYNVDNGERFTTYVILAQSGSGVISMNGAAARKVQVGDRIDGGRVVAIGDGELRYQKGGRNVTLRVPTG